MKFNVKGTTLRSLRQRYKASIDVASHITGVESETWAEWEKNGTEFSITTAKQIADKFNTHWSIFLLQENVKTINEPINHRAGYDDDARFSMKTLQAYEVARDLINASVEIDGQQMNELLKSLRKNSPTNMSSPERCAMELRRILSIDYNVLKSVTGGPAEVYKFWQEKVASLGVYVSQQDMPPDETKAFLLEERNRAVIVVSKSDRYPYSKVFSLLHELGHIIKGDASAACLTSISAKRISPGEAWCNQFASQLILPDNELLNDSLARSIKTAPEPSEVIKVLSTKYRASFTVVMYKLLKHDRISNKQYIQMQNFFEKVILPKFMNKPKKGKEIKLGKMFYVRNDVSKASTSLSREVLNMQSAGSLSYSDAARLLGTKARYIEDIKSVVGSGS